MNIEYTQPDIEALDAKRREIHRLTIIARDATEEVLKLTHEISSMCAKIETAHKQKLISEMSK